MAAQEPRHYSNESLVDMRTTGAVRSDVITRKADANPRAWEALDSLAISISEVEGMHANLFDRLVRVLDPGFVAERNQRPEQTIEREDRKPVSELAQTLSNQVERVKRMRDFIYGMIENLEV